MSWRSQFVLVSILMWCVERSCVRGVGWVMWVGGWVDVVVTTKTRLLKHRQDQIRELIQKHHTLYIVQSAFIKISQSLTLLHSTFDIFRSLSHVYTFYILHWFFVFKHKLKPVNLNTYLHTIHFTSHRTKPNEQEETT